MRKPKENFDYYADDENDTSYLDIPSLDLGDNLGEMGEPVKLPENIPESVSKLIAISYRNYGFNAYVSDLISVKRKIPDYRTSFCWNARYNPKIVQVTIIIIFHNEAWSALLRSVHSIIERTPDVLIKEILLVDDDSDMRK